MSYSIARQHLPAWLSLVLFTACSSDTDGPRLVGQLESDRIELTAEYPEQIVERFVTEGQDVAQGDPLTQQDSVRAEARVRESEAVLAQNTARLAELTRGPRPELIEVAQANHDGALKDLQFRKLELERAQSLLDRDLASHELRDKANSMLDAAESNVDATRARLEERLNGTTIEELEQAQAAVKLANALVTQREIDKDRLTISAPTNGVVDSVLFEPGERPPAGKPVAIMLSGDQPYARIYIPEAIRVRVSSGTAATVYVDGIDDPIDGRVRWVASESAFTPYFALTEHDRGRLTFAAKVDLDYAGKRLPDGVPVEVTLDLSSR